MQSMIRIMIADEDTLCTSLMCNSLQSSHEHSITGV